MLSSLAFAASVVGVALGNPFDSSLLPRAACDGNTATTRSTWCDYDLTTDYYNTVPDTGVTREYWVRISLFLDHSSAFHCANWLP